VFCNECRSEVRTSITTHATFELLAGFGTRVPPTKEKAGVTKPPKKEKAGVAKKNKAEYGGAADHSWLIEAWRRGGHTVFDPAAVAAKAFAVTLGLHRAAVMIAPKSEGSGPQTKTATKEQAKDFNASSKKSAIAASAASLVSR
jgi:hypothetical protein